MNTRLEKSAEFCTMKFFAFNKVFMRLFCVIVLVSGFSVSAQQLQDSIPLRLTEAWEYAAQYSKEIKLKQLEEKIGAEDVLDAKNQRLPELSTHASYGKLSNIPVFTNGIREKADFIPLEDHSTYGAGVEAYFNIYNGGKTNIHIDQAKTKQRLINYLAEESRDQIKYEVASAYLSLQRGLLFEKLIAKNIYSNQELLDQITKLYENGVVLKSDLLRAKLQLSKQQTQLLEVTNNAKLAHQHLNILMGFSEETPVKPIDTVKVELIQEDQDYAYYLNEAKSAPLSKAAETQVTLSELEEQELKADKLPKLGLFGEYTYSYPQIRLYPYETAPYLLGIAGIRASYDISALYNDKHKELAAALEVERQEVEKQQVDDDLRKGIKAAYQDYHEDLQNIEVALMSIEQAEENYRIVRQTYFNQLSLLTDLLDADNQLLQARFELVNSKIAARLHYYQLLKITGNL